MGGARFRELPECGFRRDFFRRDQEDRFSEPTGDFLELHPHRGKAWKLLLRHTLGMVVVVLFLELLIWALAEMANLFPSQFSLLRASIPFLHALVLLPLLVGLGGGLSRMRRRYGRRIILDGSDLRINDRVLRLAAPTYIERGELVIPTEFGSIRMPDAYQISHTRMMESCNAARQKVESLENASPRLPALPGTGNDRLDAWLRRDFGGRSSACGKVVDRGRRTAISPAWAVLLLGGGGVWGATRAQQFLREFSLGVSNSLAPLVDVLCLAALAGFLLMVVLPALSLVITQPTRRFRNWMLVSEDYLVLAGERIRIIPTRAVTDVRTLLGHLCLYSRNESIVAFPAPQLEKEILEVCGLNPERYMNLAECAEWLRCGRWRAWSLLAEKGLLVNSCNSIDRDRFHRWFPQPGLSKKPQL